MHKLEEGRLDLIIMGGDVTRSRMATTPLTPVEQRWVMSNRVLRTRGGERLTTGELLESAPLWFVSRPSDFFPRAAQAARQFGASLRNLNTCANTVALLEMIVQTGGIGIVPTVLAAEHLRAGTLEPVSPELPMELYAMTLVAHGDQSPAIVRNVIERIIHHEATIGRARQALERSLLPENQPATLARD